MGLMRTLKSSCGSVRRASSAVAVRSTSAALEARPATFVTQLDSGLRVASQRTAHRTGTLGVYVEAGARFETLSHYGCSNMLQHLLFKGTAKRSGGELTEALAKSGVRVGVEGDREIVSISARCLASEVESAAALLGEAVSQPKFTDAAVDAEKEVIFRQAKAREHKYQDFTMDLLHRTAFQGTPLENSLFGFSDSLEGLRGDDVHSFHRNYVIAPRIVIVGVGPWDHGQLVKLVQKHFSSLRNNMDLNPAYEGPCRFTSAFMSYEDDTYPACFQAVGLEGLELRHADNAVMKVVAACTGSFDRSKDLIGPSALNYINHLNYLENGRHPYRTYKFDFFNINYKDTGLFGGYWEVDENGYMPENVVRGLLREHLVRMAKGATENEVRMGVELAKTRLLKEETGLGSSRTAASIGREILYTGDRKPLAERFNAIAAVNPDQVRRVLEDLVLDKTTAFSAVGQVEGTFQSVDFSELGPNGLTYRVGA